MASEEPQPQPSFIIEYNEIRSEIEPAEDHVMQDVSSVQARIIECIRSHEVEPPELFDILINHKDNREEFSPLTEDSFSDLSWWHGTVIRVQPSPGPPATDTDESKEMSVDDSKPVQYFDEDLKLDQVTFVVDRAHLLIEVREVCQIIDISGAECSILNEVLEGTTITQEDMDLWAGYSDSGKVFHSGLESVRSFLKNMINYASNPPAKHGPLITEKMKTIAHILSQPDARERYDVGQLLLYLASHGLACNVLKEVAIEMTYSLLTGSAEEFVRQQSLENTILRSLRECRYNIVEELYSSFPGAENNIHGIATLNNYLSENMDGIPKIEDPDISNWGLPSGWEDGLVDKFHEKYTPERCIKSIKSCVKEKKIGYQQIVDWFGVRAPPSGERYAFLEQVFNSDTGEINDLYLSWMLCQMNIFAMSESLDTSG